MVVVLGLPRYIVPAPHLRPAESTLAPGAGEGTKLSKPSVRRFTNGFEIREVALGQPANGPVARPGQLVTVHYVGRLQSTGKVFDSSQRKGFSFRLGAPASCSVSEWHPGGFGEALAGRGLQFTGKGSTPPDARASPSARARCHLQQP